MVSAFKSRLEAVARNFSRAVRPPGTPADAPYIHEHAEQSLHPYRAEAQPPCKYDGHEISYRCDPW